VLKDDFDWDPPALKNDGYDWAAHYRALEMLTPRMALEGGSPQPPPNRRTPSPAAPAFDLEITLDLGYQFPIYDRDRRMLSEFREPDSSPLLINGRSVALAARLARTTTPAHLRLTAGTVLVSRGYSTDGCYEGFDKDLYEIASGEREGDFLLLTTGPRGGLSPIMPSLVLVSPNSPVLSNPNRARILMEDMQGIVRKAYPSAPFPLPLSWFSRM